MRKTTTALTIAVLILAAGVAMADKEGPQTFTGIYDWSDGDVGDLKAVFEPDGEGTWSVKFDFNWNGQDHTWTGTAKD